MSVRLPRFAPARAGLLGVLGAAVLVGACQADLPTSAEVERMDASAVAAQATRFHMVGGENMKYEVDGKAVSAEEAQAIPANRIAQVQVRKTPDGSGTISITTGTNPTTLTVQGEAVPRAQNGAPTTRVVVRDVSGNAGARSFDGLIVIDGRIVEQSAMNALNPDLIASIDVIKGPAAAAQYSDPRARKGVLRITTKAAANR